MQEIINAFHIKELTKYYHYLHDNDYVFCGHRHSDVEVNIILDGEMEITCHDSIYTVKKGEMVLIPSFVFHQNRVTGKYKAEMIVVQFQSADALWGRNFSLCRMTSDTENLLNMFCRDMEMNSKLSRGSCESLTDNSKKLLEVFLQYSFAKEQKALQRKNKYSSLYSSVVNFMLENITEKLTLTMIARSVGVSNTTLKNLFSYYTGRGCIEFFNELKLERAKELLIEGKSCLEVSEELGFSSQGYFSRRFKNFYGKSPINYKSI